MNKILVSRNKIINNLDKVEINNNNITFLYSGSYIIEYCDTSVIRYNFIVDNGVRVNLLEVSFDNEIEVNNNYEIYDGYLIVNKFYNNKSVLEKVTINLNNNGSKIDYRFSTICRSEEKYVIDVMHKNINTVSNISNKAIALNNSVLNFTVNSNVGKGMTGSILDQITRIVTFGDSHSIICPNMNIDEEDVIAKHGSIIGTFEDNIIFYLMSRGIAYNEAVRLLVRAYIFSNVLVDGDFRRKIQDIIDMYWG